MQIKLEFFKPSGKYYTEEVLELPNTLEIFEVLDYIKQNVTTYYGMYIYIKFPEEYTKGYPCLITPERRCL